MKPGANLEIEVFLSLQKGLIGEVTPALRKVTVHVGDHHVRCRAYYEGEPSEGGREAMPRVETQLYADLPHDYQVDMEVISTIPLDDLPKDWPAVFWRIE